jgi:hypothetical protein
MNLVSKFNLIKILDDFDKLSPTFEDIFAFEAELLRVDGNLFALVTRFGSSSNVPPGTAGLDFIVSLMKSLFLKEITREEMIISLLIPSEASFDPNKFNQH